ncbi:MAG: PIN/TRAM domain-containing protein [bacterium]
MKGFIFRILFILLSALIGFGAAIGMGFGIWGRVLGSVSGLLLGAIAVSLEEVLRKVHLSQIIVGAGGMFAGLLFGNVLVLSLSGLWRDRGPVVFIPLELAISLICGYLGTALFLTKKNDLEYFSKRSIIPHDVPRESYKILDTSVIIDGRIADICETGFIEGTLVIPRFVLRELQHIADSADAMKRSRGRRGLDILNKIQRKVNLKVKIEEKDFPEVRDVDAKLVKLAAFLKGKVLTNDFNLNKVAELQGVEVLNINELSNAVKPVVLPGEEMNVQVVKEGKEFNQGVAYLDDGTMVVVDGGKSYMGERIDVVVTSVLQTTAGRMIFTRPKGEDNDAGY